MGDNETVADIIAEARDKYTVHECNQCTWRKCCSKGFGSEECGKFRESIFLRLGIEDGYFTQLLDRLEAAWKREKNAIEANALFVGGFIEASRKRKPTAENSSAVGDAAAKREAVTASHGLGDCAKMREALKTVKRYLDGYTVNVLEMRSQVDAALAAPPRNCDVGTVKEQDERFHRFCAEHRTGSCAGCHNPVGDYTVAKGVRECALVWAQMPYEEGGAK
jgi:hypothetical protein